MNYDPPVLKFVDWVPTSSPMVFLVVPYVRNYPTHALLLILTLLAEERGNQFYYLHYIFIVISNNLYTHIKDGNSLKN